MKSLLTPVIFSMFLVSCAHYHETLATDKNNILEVSLVDAKHEPKVGDRVIAFNWVCETVNKGRRSSRWVCRRENEVAGKISEVVSNERIKVTLEEDFKATKVTYVDLK